MRNLSKEEAIQLAIDFGKCKTIEQQIEFCKEHEIALKFEISQEPEKGVGDNDNQGIIAKSKSNNSKESA